MHNKISTLNTKALISRLILICLVMLYCSTICAQRTRKWEISVLGAYLFNLSKEDITFGEGSKKVQGDFDLRLAYYGNPSRVVGFFTAADLGIGNVDRMVGQGFGPDRSTNVTFVIGTTISPGETDKFWFQIGLGINKLTVAGEEDYQSSGGSGGITFTGTNPYNGAISNMYLPGQLFKGYPEFERIAPVIDIGVHKKILGKFYMYGDVMPVLGSPSRNDFYLGFSFVF